MIAHDEMKWWRERATHVFQAAFLKKHDHVLFSKRWLTGSPKSNDWLNEVAKFNGFELDVSPEGLFAISCGQRQYKKG